MKKASAFIVIALFASLALQGYFLFSMKSRVHETPLLLLSQMPSDPAEARGARGARFPSGYAGPELTTDDLIRGLLYLCEQDGNGKPSPAQAKRLLPLVEDAARGKARLHELRKKEQALGRELVSESLEIFRELTPVQARYILSNRPETEQLLEELEDITRAARSK